MLYRVKDYIPFAADDVFLAPGVRVIGRVKILAGSSIWFNSVLRGDINELTVGEYSNIQDSCAVHVDFEYPTVIGNFVTIGHKAILHGCTVGNGSLIGMGAILLNGSQVGENAIVAAGTLVRERQEIPPGTLAVGTPAKVIRDLKPEEIEHVRHLADQYSKRAHEYRLTLSSLS